MRLSCGPDHGLRIDLSMWGQVGPEMMKITQDTSIENARKTLAIGKSPTHYNALHSVVAKYQLMNLAA